MMKARFIVAVAAVVVATARLASAQSAPSTPAPAPAAPTEEQANVMVHHVDMVATAVQRRLNDQRQMTGQNTPQVACLDARLAEANATRRLALERIDRARRIERRGEHGEAARERALVRHLVEQVDRIEREARACVEPPGRNRTRVTTTIDSDVPRDGLIHDVGPRSDRRAAR